MRVIHKATLVFLLKDIYYKMPVTSAVILCNGKQNPYTRKRTGEYVFSNLYPGEYNISINCKGYNSLNFPVKLQENETKEMKIDLSYNAENQNITSIPRFEINCKRKKLPLSNSNVILQLRNNLAFMKLLEPVKAGTDLLKLNLDMITGLIGQKYIYEVGKKQYEFFFFGYDSEKKSYILKNNAEEEIKEGGKFFPVWEIKTDPQGRIIMPFMSEFMKETPLKFSLISDDIKSSLEIAVNSAKISGNIFYADAKFRKIPKKRS